MSPGLRFFPGLPLALAIFICATAGAQPLRFLYWNAENYRDPRTASAGDSPGAPCKPEAAIARFVERIVEEQPTVLLLCEIAGTDSLTALQARLAEKALALPHARLVAGPDPDRCLALLSAFPVSAEHSQGWVKFEIKAEPLYLNRGVLDVTLRVAEDREIRFVGCHLKSRRDHYLGEDEIRRIEAWLIRRHLEKTVFPAAVPIVFWGDFNSDRNSPVFREIQGKRGTETYLAEVRLEDGNGQRWTYLWEPADQYSRVDFFLVSPSLHKTIDEKMSRVIHWPEWAEASDHRPLLLQLN